MTRKNILRSVLAFSMLITLVAGDSFAGRSQRITPVVKVVRKVGPAVVNISTEKMITVPSHDDTFYQFFFHQRKKRYSPYSLGSGVIIDSKGHVLTNDHVVKKASKISVTLADERTFDAILVGADPSSDLAILKINTDERLPFVKMGNSATLMIGETAIAIGNPFGLSHTVTTGVISAVNRTIKTGDREYKDFIQTDAAINPGNSGGPLLNIEGSLIGINTAIRGDAEGIGFSIPIDRARRIVNDLLLYGEVKMPWIGIKIGNVDYNIAALFNLKNKKGLLIRQAVENGPAAKAGIISGDIITGLGRRKIASVGDLETILRTYNVGDKIPVDLWRDSRGLSVIIRAGQFPSENYSAKLSRFLGVNFAETPAIEGKKAVVITAVNPGTWAGRIGLIKGDLIVQVNGAQIKNIKSFEEALAKGRMQRTITFLVANRYNLKRFTVETDKIDASY
jgi:Do/DeqQ family serine protease